MNKFGMDDYLYNLLIEFFKSKSDIKIVRIFGSRVEGTSRKASDIDMIVEGTYERKTLYEYKDEINSLRHPYLIDLYDVHDTHYTDPKFVQENYKDSAYLYIAKEYFPDETYVEQGPPSMD